MFLQLLDVFLLILKSQIRIKTYKSTGGSKTSFSPQTSKNILFACLFKPLQLVPLCGISQFIQN